MKFQQVDWKELTRSEIILTVLFPWAILFGPLGAICNTVIYMLILFLVLMAVGIV